jgi:1,4-alpha-glucan branching enzyme
MEGYLALVLHAHLPYVRHPEYEQSLEENWLFEAITETYVPLLLVIESLIEDGIDFRLTLSISPTLASMLLDTFLQERYSRKLERTLELAEREVARTASQPCFHSVAVLYRTLLERVHEAFVNRYQRNLLRGFAQFQATGKIELIASAATHGYFPLLSVNESAVRAQVRIGVDHYRQVLGRDPQGFWLPECGFFPGADRLLCEQGIRYTILETHGVTRASSRPKYGVYAPIMCPSGVAVFGRDPDSSRQVWSSTEGYPGDYDYREFYRDVGHDLDFDYIQPYIHPDGIRLDTGLKYYRITGPGDHKEPYRPDWAEQKAAIHAEHFLGERIRQVKNLGASMDRKPLVVAPYDAELFGHWWFEGPRWLEYLIRLVSEQSTVRLATLSEYLDEYPANQVATPCMSSWGHNGSNDVWLNSANDWIYRHLHAGAELIENLGLTHPRPAGLTLRAMNQAVRELLLAQASDWAFMINSGTMEGYARMRTRTHLQNLLALSRQVENASINEAALGELEARDNLFSEIDTAAAFVRAAASPLVGSVIAPALPQAPTLPSPLRIVMVTPELVPFAKTGGLADMVSSLALALEELGHEVCVILPAYRAVLQHGPRLRENGLRLRVPMAGRVEEALLLTATLGSAIPVYFIRADRYFDRPYLYGKPGGDYADNAERFAFFARAALEILRHTGAPHLLHAYDWQAALAIAFLKAQPERYPGFASLRTVLTIHNLDNQGLFAGHEWRVLGLDAGLFTPRHLEFHGQINLLKAGLVFADAITTVSPTYSREIQMPENGFGLEGVLRARADRFVGIMNGADYQTWNPQHDRFICRTYTPDDLSGKAVCKADLQRSLGLPPDPRVPLVGMVAGLVSQKGIDLIEAAAEELFAKPLQLAVLGGGDHHFEDFLRSVSDRYPEKAGIRLAFDDAAAHRIEAGADMFLMPSRYEPCGLYQLYSLKYGTIPVVRATGGLKDSVQEFDPYSGEGTGFVFEPYERAALLDALSRALGTFDRREQWRRLICNAMAADYSWARSAAEYRALYENLMQYGDLA